jgi:hypothetical protein
MHSLVFCTGGLGDGLSIVSNRNAFFIPSPHPTPPDPGPAKRRIKKRLALSGSIGPDTSSFMLSPSKHWVVTGMTAIPWKYSTDARNQNPAVIVDLETFNRIESIIEDNGLGKVHGRSRG